MSLINVKLADKQNLFASNKTNNLSVYDSQVYSKAMPSLFNYYTPSYFNFYAPNYFNFWNLFSFYPNFNFFPKFSFTPTFYKAPKLNFDLKPQTNLFTNITKLNNYSSPSNNNSLLQNNKSKLTFDDVEYNAQKGNQLATAVRNNTKGFQGDCALYVRLALEKCGLGTGERGDGYEYSRILSRNNNFKEISTAGINLSDLPAGCVLVYGKGTSGYSSSAGHVEITLGNGQAASDGVTNNIRQGARVFVPV